MTNETKIFDIDKRQKIVCQSRNTRNGFRHEATLLVDNTEREKAKINYLNRTWESWEFQSVIKELLEKAGFSEKEREKVMAKLDKGERTEISKEFGLLSGVMKIGEILSKNKKQANDFKVKMLKAKFGDSLILPDDWNELSESEKAKRLEKIEAEFQNS